MGFHFSYSRRLSSGEPILSLFRESLSQGTHARFWAAYCRGNQSSSVVKKASVVLKIPSWQIIALKPGLCPLSQLIMYPPYDAPRAAVRSGSICHCQHATAWDREYTLTSGYKSRAAW